jgi:nucleoside-diphosphate-sugar epimerase
MIHVLGGRGLVGSAFVRYCQRTGREFDIIELDNYERFIGRPCRILVNANGNSRKPLAKQAPVEDFDASVRSVRSSLVHYPCDLYVHLSSCDVYPDCSSPESTREDQALDPAAQSPYGFHKYLAEQCVRHAARRWLIFRFGGFVGPGLRKNAVFDILHGGPLWLDPASQLQFLHTEHAAEIVLGLAESGLSGETLNLCGRGLIQLQEVIDATGRDIPVQPGSSVVRYDVNIEAVSRHAMIPETRATVLDFVTGFSRGA